MLDERMVLTRAMSTSMFNRLLKRALVDINPGRSDLITTSGGLVTALLNGGYGGSAYDLDTIVGTAANLRVHPTGTLLSFGATTSGVSTPDAAPNRILGDIDIRLRSTPRTAWTTGYHSIYTKDGSAGNRGVGAWVDPTTGLMTFRWSANGTALITKVSTAGLSGGAGTIVWLRYTLDVDNGAAGNTVTFYTSTDDVEDSADVSTWTQLGDPVVTAGTTSIFNSTATVTSGYGGGIGFDGLIHRLQVYNGINGTLAVDFNPTDAASDSAATLTSSATGEVWTRNGNAFWQNTGHTVVHSIGSVGIETTAGQTIANPMTIFAVARFAGTPGADFVMLGPRSSASAETYIYTDQTNGDKFTFFQGSGEISLDEAFDNDSHVFALQGNGDATSTLTVSGVGSKTGDGGSEALDVGTLFANLAGANTMQGYIARLLVLPIPTGQAVPFALRLGGQYAGVIT